MIKLPKPVTAILKIAISLVLLYFIFSKIQFREVAEIIRRSRVGYLVIAILFFILSKVLASFRLNCYLHRLKIYLTQTSNLKLYSLGMFYNLFLPGGIGGDAYKGYILKKKFEIRTKSIIAVLLLDRFSGLLLLFILACILCLLLPYEFLVLWKIPIGFAIVLSVFIFWGIHKKLFSYLLPIFWKSFGYSAFVQCSQLLCVLFILMALKIEVNVLTYLFIFLISSIVSILPITIGGIGIREVVFYYGAIWLNLAENTSVTISVVFFLITAFVSLFGLIYHFKKPDLKLISSQLR